MVTLGEGRRRTRPAAAGRASILRMGVRGRLAMAGAAALLLWSAIALGLS